MIKYFEARQQVVDTGVKMAASALTVGTWGNISVRVEGENKVAITPSGVDYETMKPEDVVIVDLEGQIVDGTLKPSIEVPLHLDIYNCREDVNAIVHTHSTYCTAMAIARKAIPAACEDLVQIVGGEVSVAEYVLPGTPGLGKAAVKALGQKNAVLLANHGLVAAGKDMKEAHKIAVVVEKSAHATCMAATLGGVVVLDQSDVDIMRNFYVNIYGQR